MKRHGMAYLNDRDHAVRYARKFGQIAVNMGFINKDQVKDALTEQLSLNSFMMLRPRKLIGEILFENGWITLKQIEIVLEEISRDQSSVL
jgi:hypothetical protein